MDDRVINSIVSGVDDTLSDESKKRINQSLVVMTKKLTDAKQNKSTQQSLLGNGDQSKPQHTRVNTDAEIYTNIADMINTSNSDSAGFGTLMDSLVSKNKKYYSIIKDYEIMPILIPQINRVLMFLVNECLSPDIQNDSTFMIKYDDQENDPKRIQQDINDIKHDERLDNILRDVYTERYKLGHVYYSVIDYNKTFDHMKDMINRKTMNESTVDMSDSDYLEKCYAPFSSTINECSCQIRIQTIADGETEDLNEKKPLKVTSAAGDHPEVKPLEETVIDLSFDNMNIVVERNPLGSMVENAYAELLTEAYSSYSIDAMLDEAYMNGGSLNEAVVDTTKLSTMIDKMKQKKLRRCAIQRLDPAKVFKLKVGGKTIGYFVISDLTEQSNNMVNFAQSLKDQLLKSRATNIQQTSKTAEEVISKTLAEKIVNTFDPHIGINRIEDIDLMHDFILNNEIYKGNKRITFYYADEIFDMSRSDESILTNGVFFTKLYATLLLNNIMTKVLRGRGRQIHTVRMGASPNVQRYIQNAMASLTMPENNLGTMHGSFEQMMNPFNSSSDIIIPTEDDAQKYIETDYIPGQDVNMDDEFLRTLLNAIVSSFGLDSAVIDATSGNVQFARTLSMESLQICNSVKNEQQDLHDSWEAFCLRILEICGSDGTREAVQQGLVEVKFFEPKSLVMQTIIDDMNNAKTYAENIADTIPLFQNDGTDQIRAQFVSSMIRDRVNINWDDIDEALRDAIVEQNQNDIQAQLQKIIEDYKSNIKVERYGDTDGDGVISDDDTLTDEEKDLLDTDLGGADEEI